MYFEHIDTDGRAVAALALSPGGNALAACFGESIVVAEVPGNLSGPAIDATTQVRDVAFSPDGSQLAVACDDAVRVFEVPVASPAASREMTGAHGGFHTVAWSPDGSLVAAGHFEPQVSVFDAARGEPVATLDPKVFDDEGRTRVCFSPDGEVLASTAYNGVVFWRAAKMWAAGAAGGKPRKKVVKLRGHAHLVDASFLSDGALLAALAETEGDDCALHVWDVGSYRKLNSVPLPHYSTRLASAPGGPLVAVAESGGEGVSLWNAATGERAKSEFGGAAGLEVGALAADSRSGLVVAGTESGKILGWQTAES